MLATLALTAAFASSGAACIFDSGGDYKGGGRIGDKASPPPEDAGKEASSGDGASGATDSGTIDFDF